jgi:hypothetical protein
MPRLRLQDGRDISRSAQSKAPNFLTFYISPNMPQGFDKCKERPAHIDEILNGLNRYNPETTTVFQEYVNQQCEEKFFDAYASLALLKL